MFGCPTLQTDRLVLRQFVESDLDGYFTILDTTEVRTALRVADSVDRSSAWSNLAIWLGQWALRNSGRWAIEPKSTGELIGRAGSHRAEKKDWPGLEIGWTFHSSHWGNGYAAEAGRASGEWTFANHPVYELVSRILLDNHRSQAVAKRLGFHLREEETLSTSAAKPHGIWLLPRTGLE